MNTTHMWWLAGVGQLLAILITWAWLGRNARPWKRIVATALFTSLLINAGLWLVMNQVTETPAILLPQGVLLFLTFGLVAGVLTELGYLCWRCFWMRDAGR